jgi:hypothetical protein
MTNAPPSEFKPEQRLTFRLLSYWNRIRGEREFPTLSDVNIHEIEEMWHFSFTLDVSREEEHFFQYFGPELSSIFGTDFTGENVAEAMNDVILNNTVGSYVKCIEKREPTMEAASFFYDGKELRYRTLIVPFSSDGQKVDYLMGTTNYKAF